MNNTLNKLLLELKEYVDIAIEMEKSVILVKMTDKEVVDMRRNYPKDSLLLGPFVITRNRFPSK